MKDNIHALENILEQVPQEAVSQIISAISSHNRIFVYGAGRSGLMLKAFAMRLAQAGRIVYVVGETITPALEREDLLILASASGKTSSVLRYAQTAHEVGADLCVITASKNSPLTEGNISSVLIPAPTKDTVTAGIMGTLFEQSLLLFCDFVIENMGEDPVKMRSRHANLE